MVFLAFALVPYIVGGALMLESSLVGLAPIEANDLSSVDLNKENPSVANGLNE